MKLRSLGTLALAATSSLGLAAAGCGEEVEPVADNSSAIIGGVDASGPAFEAVGTLVTVMREYDDPMVPPDMAPPDAIVPFCTATLIEQATVLTAQHCLDTATPEALAEMGPTGSYLAFAIGADARMPDRIVPIVRGAVEQEVPGGVLGLGSDVAIAHLAGAVKDIEPIRFAPFRDELIGQRLAIAGFGVQNQTYKYATRKWAQTTAHATSGNVFELMYGDFETFAQKVLEDWPFIADGLLAKPDSPEVQAQLRKWYDESTLLDGYELLHGTGAEDGSTCYGDSGGPLLHKGPDGLEVVGVTSWGGYSEHGMCNREDVAAVLGPKVVEFIEAELASKTHACDAIAFGGECDGDAVLLCTDYTNRGERKVSRIDCGFVAQQCVDHTQPTEGEGEEEAPMGPAFGASCQDPAPPAEDAEG